MQALSGWMGSVVTQPFSALSKGVQLDSGLGSGWATQGHAQTFSKPLLCFLGCVLQVIVIAQSEVQSALEQVFFKDLGVLCCIHLSLYQD